MKMDFKSDLPKICVPLVGEDLQAVTEEIKSAGKLPIDLLEWRMDHFFGDPIKALPVIAKAAGELPLLCTLRSKTEGGLAEGDSRRLSEIVLQTIKSGECQLVDIELSLGRRYVNELVNAAKECSVMTVISKHDFEKTPPLNELLESFSEMNELGGDICKIAVMPLNRHDVLTLMEASLTASGHIEHIAAISMGEIGKISRVSSFGSCLTFAAGQQASAPGQISAVKIREILKELG